MPEMQLDLGRAACGANGDGLNLMLLDHRKPSEGRPGFTYTDRLGELPNQLNDMRDGPFAAAPKDHRSVAAPAARNRRSAYRVQSPAPSTAPRRDVHFWRPVPCSWWSGPCLEVPLTALGSLSGLRVQRRIFARCNPLADQVVLHLEARARIQKLAPRLSCNHQSVQNFA